ncbi:MAG: hypothetical protein IJR28_01245 [Ottowia sp.]|nr:hypothetical protein [Ottowia sp.]
MKRIFEMLMAALVAGVVAGLVWVAARALPLGEEVACSADGVCVGPSVLSPFFAFLFCIPAAGILQWLAWRMADSWMPRARAIKRAAALSLIIMKITYILCMALALALLLISLPEQGEAMMIFGIIVLSITFPAGWLVAAVVAVMEEVAKAIHMPLALPDSMMAVFWLAFFAAGWWQWFIEVPTLWRRWQAGRY